MLWAVPYPLRVLYKRVRTRFPGCAVAAPVITTPLQYAQEACIGGVDRVYNVPVLYIYIYAHDSRI